MEDFGNTWFLPILSSAIGWGYFFAWSISFYPQVILNWKRQSVQGLSVDFLCYNVYGFLCYWIFNASFFFSKEIQEEYKNRNDSKENLVRFNDVMFATHALCISLFTLVQTKLYKKDNSQRLSKIAQRFIKVTVVGIMGSLILVLTGTFMWIDLLYCLSYIKLTISVIKYIPQAWINYKRKSTIGWSIHNILLDFTGGTLSITQLFLDAYIASDWSGILGNFVKLGLGLQSILFDVIFMIQHYVLYNLSKDDILNTADEERRRLVIEDRIY